MVQIVVGTLHDVDEIELPRIVAGLEIWAARHGAHQAAVPISADERLRIAAALACDDTPTRSSRRRQPRLDPPRPQ
jgi:hypothetical protein